MASAGHSWEQPDPAEFIPLTSAAEWAALAARYIPNFNPNPLERCFEVARLGGALSVVAETRYMDLDYRSEYSAFYSKTFSSIPDTAHRLHFFAGNLDASTFWQLPADSKYLGYVVIRPSELGRVGRTVLAPPPDLVDAVRNPIGFRTRE